jgi:hypothetical protein
MVMSKNTCGRCASGSGSATSTPLAACECGKQAQRIRPLQCTRASTACTGSGYNRQHAWPQGW